MYDFNTTANNHIGIRGTDTNVIAFYNGAYLCLHSSRDTIGIWPIEEFLRLRCLGII